ncbi:MAG: hypothetical protein HZY76_22335 [Anaerolineae bacterium]|nr:MAG: hypothetical protein HZY76_22335 [Anaerolineae bacterium]
MNEIQLRLRVDSAVANATYPLAIDLFQAAPGAVQGQVAAGQVFLGRITYNAADAGLTVTRRFTPTSMPEPGDLIVATATDALGNTSEFSLAMPTNIAAFRVTDLGDSADLNGNDCICATASDTCTLRAAIQTANACPGSNAIAFALAGTITPATPLPALSDPSGVLIDAFTAPGAQVNTPDHQLDRCRAGRGPEWPAADICRAEHDQRQQPCAWPGHLRLWRRRHRCQRRRREHYRRQLHWHGPRWRSGARGQPVGIQLQGVRMTTTSAPPHWKAVT